MPRLFVAIEFPPQVSAELARLRPPALPGVRLSRQEQLHLTLHFIGEAGIAPVAAALQEVIAAPFGLRLDGLGQFRASGGGHTLWAGVEGNDELLALHAVVAQALAVTDYLRDARRYRPHVTLARCRPEVSADVIKSFLGQTSTLSYEVVPVTGFALYSSSATAEGSIYHCEQRYRLQSLSP